MFTPLDILILTVTLDRPPNAFQCCHVHTSRYTVSCSLCAADIFVKDRAFCEQDCHVIRV